MITCYNRSSTASRNIDSIVMSSPSWTKVTRDAVVIRHRPEELSGAEMFIILDGISILKEIGQAYFTWDKNPLLPLKRFIRVRISDFLKSDSSLSSNRL